MSGVSQWVYVLIAAGILLASIAVLLLAASAAVCMYRRCRAWAVKREAAEAENPVATQVRHKSELAGGRETILSVDDEPFVLQTNTHVLGDLGYRVLTANGGEQAVNIVREQPVDLVLLDLVMPAMDGVETLRRIHAVKPGVKAVILSGYAQPSQVEAVRQMGAMHYLIKPVPTSLLARAIRDELDGSGADR